MSSNNLYRTETAICAMSANTLQPDSWAHDSILAAGMCAQRNRLGNLLMHFIDSPKPSLVMEITLVISSRLIDRSFDKGLTLDAAYQAFDYWNGRRCLRCGGRGVMNFQQEECQQCHGTGERPIDGSDMVRAGISILIEAENQMEGQLRKKLAPEYVPEHKYTLPEKYEELARDDGIGY